VCTLGLWIAAGLFQHSISYNNRISVIIIAGALLALLNTVIKPLLVVISMPIMLITLGLFMVVLNGLTVYLVSVLYGPLHIEHFWTAICAGIIIGLVNYLVTTILENE
jgi:putative membrane protein